uniref:Uncharacterized protein n=1 Tax=viral metagenome TaxID=1070528 RepID=A0A6C0CU62_9ZZZZ
MMAPMPTAPAKIGVHESFEEGPVTFVALFSK